MTSNHCDGQVKYICQLSHGEWHKLREMLAPNDTWEDLAELMKWDVTTVDDLRRKTNPTESFLTKLKHLNYTTTDLFLLLSKVPDYKLMTYLKPFVEQKHHHLISDGDSNFERLLICAEDNLDEKDLKIGLQNFNNVQSDEVSGKNCIVNNQTNKGSGARKILNNPLQPITVVPGDSGNSPAQQSAPGTPKINNIFKFLYDTTLPQISYGELAEATSDWRENNILGKGGFGTVFEGWWKRTPVAIKRIEQCGPGTIESYLIQLQRVSRELEMLNSCTHDNILSLFAYSMGPEAPCLVYQLMINGSLEDRLWSKKRGDSLTWLQRHNIAKGTAKGLHHLHTVGEIPLIHGNIKSANILLDQNLEPKIGDFGLAQEVPEVDSMKISKIHGTQPYLPLEYLQYKTLSTKTDMYSYGIVLFELATGFPAYDDGRPRNKFLKDFIDSREPHHLYILKDLKAGTENEQVFENLIVLGKLCSNTSAKQRPEMVSVLEKLC